QCHYLFSLPDALPLASVPFDIEPNAALLAAMAEELGIVALRKVTFHGKLAPLGRRDWQLYAELGATALQECVATLEDVTSRVDRSEEHTSELQSRENL